MKGLVVGTHGPDADVQQCIEWHGTALHHRGGKMNFTVDDHGAWRPAWRRGLVSSGLLLWWFLQDGIKMVQIHVAEKVPACQKKS